MSLLDKLRWLFVQPETPKHSVSPAPVVEPASASKPSSELRKTPDVESKCPYCGHTLERKPLRKKKCLSCGNYIFVRSTPTGQAKILVTGQQAAEIEKQWERYHEEKELENLLNSDPEYKQEYERTKTQLMVKRGSEPSVGDARWALANKRLLRFARRGDWGLYRNTKMEMAKQLQVEQKLKQALRTYLEVCYLDVNGPNNLGGERDPDMLEMYPPFDPTMGLIAPGIIWEVQELCKSLGLQAEGVKNLFIGMAVRNHKNLRLPIDPAQGWEMIAQDGGFVSEEEELELARLARGSGYDLLAVALDRKKRLESSGAAPEQYDEVLSILNLALGKDISPHTRAIVHRHIGEIQHKCGRDADAIQHLEMAIILNLKIGVDSLRK